MVTPPLPSGCACPGLTGAPGRPMYPLGSEPSAVTVTASFAAICAAVASAIFCTCTGVSGGGEMSAAIPKITSSVSSTAPAVTAT